MATTKAKTTRKRVGKKKSSSKAALKLKKYMDEVKIGNYSWEDVLKSTGKHGSSPDVFDQQLRHEIHNSVI